MSTKDFTANVISATKVVPDGNFADSKASGIWDINEVLDLIKGGNWPNVANISPSAFVDALFQTHLYTGTGATHVINNGINLSGKGGLTWIKQRNASIEHFLFDTERGATKSLSNDTNGEYASSTTLTGFNSNGFTLSSSNYVNGTTSAPRNYASWTFREQPKFFDIVTYTGTGSARTVAHNLGTTVGMMLVKRLGSANWAVYHRANTAAPQTDYLILNTTAATADDSAWWNDTAPTSSVFTVGTDDSVNKDGSSYVAYLFAHNNDDGGFGVAGDQDIIKCGSYTGNGSTTGVFQDLGFEPQWIISKNAGLTEPWVMLDNKRGVGGAGSNDPRLVADGNNAEAGGEIMKFDATGFTPLTADDKINGNNYTYVYMAIRRGGMQTPTAASSVFQPHIYTGDGSTRVYDLNITPDMVINISRSDNGDEKAINDRVTENEHELYISGTDAAYDASSGSQGMQFDHTKKIEIQSYRYTNGNAYLNLCWARAKGYFTMVTYTGTGSNRTIAHNLGVAPEMMWLKKRSATNNWKTFHSNLGGTKSMELNTTVEAETNGSAVFNSTAPTSSVFSLGTAGDTNGNNATYIAYLFATVANVSKVGSFTQSGATNVACGFTGSTPAFILLKRTDAAGNWYAFDSARGIVAGNDKSVYFNDTSEEVTNADVVDPYSGGFATTSTLTNGDYIFYAIASVA